MRPTGADMRPGWGLAHPLASAALVAALVAVLAMWTLPPAGARAAGDANESTCPNEASPGYRTYLPDCRGYDMVSPPYKGGSRLFFPEPLGAISENGEHLLVNSWGGFAGTENNENTTLSTGGAAYELSRSGDIWSAEPLSPPGTEVSHGIYVAASPDLSRTLWELIEEPAPPETELLSATRRYKLAIRVHEPGSPARFEAVGPEDNPNETFDTRNFEFSGASSDLSHVVYSIEARSEKPTWPGDKTEHAQSLYEYVGVKNSEPQLVGVKNSGAPPWEAGAAHVNDGAELISVCGTVLGAPSEAYNAVSTDGETIFFTAHECFETAGEPEVNELFARVNGQHTVKISEPVLPGGSAGECKAGEPCVGATHKEGNFRGADENGRRVFFLSEQPLVNGASEEGQKLYEDRLEGTGAAAKVVEVLDLSNPTGYAGLNPEVQGVVRVSENGERVYFVANGALTTEPNREGKSPTSGESNLYVYEPDPAHPGASHVAFVATLSTEDSRDWREGDNNRSAQATPNGGFLIFVSEADLTGDDTSTAAQLFEYDAGAESLSRVSIGQCPAAMPSCAAGERFNNNGNISEGQLVPMIRTPVFEGHNDPTEAASTLSLSADGRVFFTSLDALTPLAVQGANNIYEYSSGHVYLIAAGEDPALELSAFGELESPFANPGRLVSTDEAGTDVFLGAVGQLVPQDTDTQADVYDARVGGGAPLVRAAGGCSGAACRGPGSAAPTLAGAPSATLAGENVAVAAPTPKPKVLTRLQKLARALKACAKKRNKKKRHRCQAAAHKRYAAKAAAKSSNRRGK